MIFPFQKYKPKIHPKAFVAPNASIIGRVEIKEGASIWFGAVLRGDINRIVIGKKTNVQDNSVLHVESTMPCVLKDGVIMGHQATAHACTIEDGALIGIGARVLNGAVIGKYSIIGAGSVVLEGTRIPPYSLVVGTPGKVVRKVSKKEIQQNKYWAVKYEKLGRWYRMNLKDSKDLNGIAFLKDLSHIF